MSTFIYIVAKDDGLAIRINDRDAITMTYEEAINLAARLNARAKEWMREGAGNG